MHGPEPGEALTGSVKTRSPKRWCRTRSVIMRPSKWSPAALGGREPSLFRLDIIDLALYKTLMEHPELLRTMDWRTFEKLLADILASMGFEIELQRGTKDGGVDIFAIRNQELIGAQRFLIQAKRYKNKVGVEPVRQLMFLHQHHRVTKVCLATTALFTKGAWNLAEQYKWQLELRDFDGVHDWIRQAARQKV